jgi:hypothetical protein
MLQHEFDRVDRNGIIDMNCGEALQRFQTALLNEARVLRHPDRELVGRHFVERHRPQAA